MFEPETRRLKLRQWCDEDLPAFAAMNADPQVMEYFPALLSRDESDKMAGRIRSLIAERGWGFWALETKHNREFIGFTGLHTPQDELPFLPCVEIGWRLARTSWGKGYATEAANAALEVAFTKLDVPEIVAFTSIDNSRSRAVMERLGMQNTGKDFEHPAVPPDNPLRPHVLYKLTKTRWQQLLDTRAGQ